MQERPEVDLEQILGGLRRALGRIGFGGGRFLPLFLIVLVVGFCVWLGTGVYMVEAAF